MHYETINTQAKIAELMHNRCLDTGTPGSHDLESCRIKQTWVVASAGFLGKLMPTIVEEIVPQVREDERAKLADPAVRAVVELVEQRDREYRRAEAAHEAKDEANRRWLTALTVAAPDPADDLDVHLAEQMADPTFAAAYRAREVEIAKRIADHEIAGGGQ